MFHTRGQSLCSMCYRASTEFEKDEGSENSGFNIMMSNLEKIMITYLRKLLGNLAANASRITDLSRGLSVILNAFFFLFI